MSFDANEDLVKNDGLISPDELAARTSTIDGPTPTSSSLVSDKSSYTWEQAADQLATFGWSSAGTSPITFAFRSDNPNDPGFGRFDAALIDAAQTALDLWSDIANIDFQRVGTGTTGDAAYSNDASILFSADTDSGGYAWAYFPGSTSSGSLSGDVFLNTSGNYFDNVSSGTYDFLAILHEIGHAIGLDHPGAYNGGAPNYADDAEYLQDSRQYTLMSYFDAEETGAVHGWNFAATPLLHDIAAAQELYGANLTTRTEDTTYGFNSTADRDAFSIDSSTDQTVFAIWDAGGNDTLDLSGYRDNQKLDLNEEAFSDAGALTANIAIARGAIIENGSTGAGDDTIIGNASDNQLVGNAGKDTLDGNDGNDTLFGNSSNDTLRGGSGDDILSGGKHKDYLYGGDDNDILRGDTGDDYLYGDAGNDHLIGGSGIDRLRGGDGDDIIDGGSGDDKFYADGGNDMIIGGSGFDTLDYAVVADGVTVDLHAHTATGASIGTDEIWGIEQIDGTLGDDNFKGDLRDNVFRGRDGDDVFRGLQGSDTFKGGPGNDTYLYSETDIYRDGQSQGLDTILDYSVSGDTLDFSQTFAGRTAASVEELINFDETAEGTIVQANIDGVGFVDVVLLAGVVGTDVNTLADDGFLIV